MDYLLYDSETRYFGILVFEFLMDNTVVCFILNFTCGKLICNDCAFSFNFDYMVFDTAGYFWKRDIALY